MNSRLTDSTAKAPDKGEVGGSSPPRPTIQITSKYATTLAFPPSGISVKNRLSNPGQLCLSDWATVLSERFMFKMADAAAVFGNGVAFSTELVLIGR
jgi:hypothetical protein